MTDANLSPTHQTIRRAMCSKCGGVRNCEIRGEYIKEYNDDDGNYWERISWFILECRGCDHVFAHTVATNSGNHGSVVTPGGTHEFQFSEMLSYWPAVSKRRGPTWILEAGIAADKSGSLQAALLEVYGALDNDLHMLAAIGIRTVWDHATELLGIDPRLTFENKLTELVTRKLIGSLDRDRMQIVVDAGSASAHRGWRPTPTDIKTMMDVLEHFIQTTFVDPEHTARLDAATARVKNTVPPRETKSVGRSALKKSPT